MVGDCCYRVGHEDNKNQGPFLASQSKTIRMNNIVLDLLITKRTPPDKQWSV